MILDGTAWDESLPLTPAVRKRVLWGYFGGGYLDPRLEEKRLAAIEWLRRKSTVGWILDRKEKE